MSRPLQYKNPDEMQAVIYEYFKGCKSNGEGVGVEGHKEAEITPDVHPSIIGMCVALQLSYTSLSNYEQKDEFVGTIEQAKQVIEAYNVQRLYDSQVTGVKFVLINGFKWKDRQEIEHSGDIGHNGGVCRASEILQGFIESRQVDPDERTG